MAGGANEGGARHLARARKTPPGRTIAVTGACGFLGSNLVALLEEDATVANIVILDVSMPPTVGAKSRFYETDLSMPGVAARLAEVFQAERVDVLVHAAFVSRPTPATTWAHELESVGTMHVLDACRRRPVPRIVMTSTVLVYGPHPSNPNFLSETHPTRGLQGSNFVTDKLDAEAQVLRFAKANDKSAVVVLRFAPMLGPNVDNFVARWLSRRVVPVVMGHDPLLQLVHEMDALAALKLAVDRDVRGIFNIVGEGVLPVSTALKLSGRIALPVPYRWLRRATALLWSAHVADASPALVAALRYLCVADGERAKRELGFVPVHTTRDALLDFESTQRLRSARLLRGAA